MRSVNGPTNFSILQVAVFVATASCVAACTSGELDAGNETDASMRDGNLADSETVREAGPDGSMPDGQVLSDAGLDGAGGEDAGSTGPNVDRSIPGLHEFALDPKDVDQNASTLFETQFAQLDTRAAPLGKLVIFLPGFGNTPAGWRDHGRLLASYGFHVLIPHYNNNWSSNGCSGSCPTDTRWEALTGDPVSDQVDIARADSAEGRAIALLHYLDSEHPGGDWTYYLDGNDDLRGQDVIIAGISHGAASAGLYAQRRSVSRAVMHSGGWYAADDQATPVSLYYGISHTDDEQHAAHLSSWENIGLDGSPTSLDDASAPFGNAHQLITSEFSTYPHCSVAVHSSSPRDDQDELVFDAAWRYLYGAPAP